MVIFGPFRVPVARDPRELISQEGGHTWVAGKIEFLELYEGFYSIFFTKDFTIVG